MKRHLDIKLVVLTIFVIIINYIAYYLDDILIIYGWPATGLLVQGIRAVAFPVTWYVQVVEPYTLFAVPVLGRAFNYCIEFSYFYLVVCSVRWCLQRFDKFCGTITL